MTQGPQFSMPYENQTNPLGLAGFICSIVGLVVTGGLLCPIGLILSLIALGRQPRGFAIAGVIIGLLGSCGLLVGVVFVVGALVAGVGLASMALLSEREKTEITADMITMAVAIKQYEDENDYLPAELSLLDLSTSRLVDPWGNSYRYLLTDADDSGFDLVSSGEDGQEGTEDDIRLSTLDETWSSAAVRIEGDDDSGRVSINMGGASLEAEGEEGSGRVTIELGDRVLEIVGDEDGGRITLDDSDAQAAEAEVEADASAAEAPAAEAPEAEREESP